MYVLRRFANEGIVLVTPEIPSKCLCSGKETPGSQLWENCPVLCENRERYSVHRASSHLSVCLPERILH